MAGPIVVGLDADHPSPGELVITASLHTPEPGAAIFVEGLSKERIAYKPIIEFPVGPDAADVGADVAAGPAEDIDRRRRRPVHWGWPGKIGRRRRGSCQRGKSDCRDQELLHDAPPMLMNPDGTIYSLANLRNYCRVATLD